MELMANMAGPMGNTLKAPKSLLLHSRENPFHLSASIARHVAALDRLESALQCLRGNATQLAEKKSPF